MPRPRRVPHTGGARGTAWALELPAAGGQGSGLRGGPGRLSSLSPAGTSSPWGPAWRLPPTLGRSPRTSSTPSTRTWWSSSKPPRWTEAGHGEEQAPRAARGRGGGAAPGPRAGAGPGLGLGRRPGGGSLGTASREPLCTFPIKHLGHRRRRALRRGPGTAGGIGRGPECGRGGAGCDASGGQGRACALRRFRRGPRASGGGSRAQVRGARCHGDG